MGTGQLSREVTPTLCVELNVALSGLDRARALGLVTINPGAPFANLAADSRSVGAAVFSEAADGMAEALAALSVKGITEANAKHPILLQQYYSAALRLGCENVR